MAITYVDTEYTKAYLRHLFAANEYLGNKLLPSNLGFYMWLVREARKHILAISELGKRNDGA
jgi:queuine tRNA-ribosyltransferase